MKNLILIFTLTIGVLFSSLVLAETNSAENIKSEGYLSRVDLTRSEIVIGDTLYNLALNLKVFDRKGKAVGRYALKEGLQVSFEWGFRNETYQVDKIKIVKKNAN